MRRKRAESDIGAGSDEDKSCLPDLVFRKTLFTWRVSIDARRDEEKRLIAANREGSSRTLLRVYAERVKEVGCWEVMVRY